MIQSTGGVGIHHTMISSSRLEQWKTRENKYFIKENTVVRKEPGAPIVVEPESRTPIPLSTMQRHTTQ